MPDPIRLAAFCEALADGARTPALRHLAQAAVSSSSPEMFQLADLAWFDALSRRARLRRFGGDCPQYGLLGAGGSGRLTACVAGG